GDAVEQRLLDERQAQAGLAAAGHADAHRVGDEILRVIEDETRARLLGAEVIRSAEVEDAELLEVGGGGLGRGGPGRRRRRIRGTRCPARLVPGGSTDARRHGRLPAWVVRSSLVK